MSQAKPKYQNDSYSSNSPISLPKPKYNANASERQQSYSSNSPVIQHKPMYDKGDDSSNREKSASFPKDSPPSKLKGKRINVRYDTGWYPGTIFEDYESAQEVWVKYDDTQFPDEIISYEEFELLDDDTQFP